jgi:DNA-binding MarR family transcriptional regulator
VTLISLANYTRGMSDVKLAADTELAPRLRLTVTRLARKLRQQAEQGLTPSLLMALSSIERHGRITMGELCAVEQIQPPSMTRIVAALVEAGLVARDPDPADRRIAWVSATPEGVRLLQRTRRRKEAYLSKRLRSLDGHDLAVLEEAIPILEGLVESGP